MASISSNDYICMRMIELLLGQFTVIAKFFGVGTDIHQVQV